MTGLSGWRIMIPRASPRQGVGVRRSGSTERRGPRRPELPRSPRHVNRLVVEILLSLLRGVAGVLGLVGGVALAAHAPGLALGLAALALGAVFSGNDPSTAPGDDGQARSAAIWNGQVEPVWGDTLDLDGLIALFDYSTQARPALLAMKPSARDNRLEQIFLGALLNAAQRSGRFKSLDFARLRQILVDPTTPGRTPDRLFTEYLADAPDAQQELARLIAYLVQAKCAAGLLVYRWMTRWPKVDPSNVLSIRLRLLTWRVDAQPLDASLDRVLKELLTVESLLEAFGVFWRDVDGALPVDRILERLRFTMRYEDAATRAYYLALLKQQLEWLAGQGHAMAQAVLAQYPSVGQAPERSPLQWVELDEALWVEARRGAAATSPEAEPTAMADAAEHEASGTSESVDSSPSPVHDESANLHLSPDPAQEPGARSMTADTSHPVEGGIDWRALPAFLDTTEEMTRLRLVQTTPTGSDPISPDGGVSPNGAGFGGEFIQQELPQLLHAYREWRIATHHAPSPVDLAVEQGLKNEEVVIIGQGMSERELLGFLELFPGLRAVHLLDARLSNLRMTDYLLNHRLSGEPKLPHGELLAYHLNVAEQDPVGLAGRVSIVFDSKVFDGKYMTDEQLRAMAQRIEWMLKPGGLHISSGDLHLDPKYHSAAMEQVPIPQVDVSVTRKRLASETTRIESAPSNQSVEAEVRPVSDLGLTPDSSDSFTNPEDHDTVRSPARGLLGWLLWPASLVEEAIHLLAAVVLGVPVDGVRVTPKESYVRSQWIEQRPESWKTAAVAGAAVAGWVWLAWWLGGPAHLLDPTRGRSALLVNWVSTLMVLLDIVQARAPDADLHRVGYVLQQLVNRILPSSRQLRWVAPPVGDRLFSPRRQRSRKRDTPPPPELSADAIRALARHRMLELLTARTPIIVPGSASRAFRDWLHQALAPMHVVERLDDADPTPRQVVVQAEAFLTAEGWDFELRVSTNSDEVLAFFADPVHQRQWVGLAQAFLRRELAASGVPGEIQVFIVPPTRSAPVNGVTERLHALIRQLDEVADVWKDRRWIDDGTTRRQLGQTVQEAGHLIQSYEKQPAWRDRLVALEAMGRFLEALSKPAEARAIRVRRPPPRRRRWGRASPRYEVTIPATEEQAELRVELILRQVISPLLIAELPGSVRSSASTILFGADSSKSAHPVDQVIHLDLVDSRKWFQHGPLSALFTRSTDEAEIRAAFGQFLDKVRVHLEELAGPVEPDRQSVAEGPSGSAEQAAEAVNGQVPQRRSLIAASIAFISASSVLSWTTLLVASRESFLSPIIAWASNPTSRWIASRMRQVSSWWGSWGTRFMGAPSAIRQEEGAHQSDETGSRAPNHPHIPSRRSRVNVAEAVVGVAAIVILWKIALWSLPLAMGLAAGVGGAWLLSTALPGDGQSKPGERRGGQRADGAQADTVTVGSTRRVGARPLMRMTTSGWPGSRVRWISPRLKAVSSGSSATSKATKASSGRRASSSGRLSTYRENSNDSSRFFLASSCSLIVGLLPELLAIAVAIVPMKLAWLWRELVGTQSGVHGAAEAGGGLADDQQPAVELVGGQGAQRLSQHRVHVGHRGWGDVEPDDPGVRAQRIVSQIGEVAIPGHQQQPLGARQAQDFTISSLGAAQVLQRDTRVSRVSQRAEGLSPDAVVQQQAHSSGRGGSPELFEEVDVLAGEELVRKLDAGPHIVNGEVGIVQVTADGLGSLPRHEKLKHHRNWNTGISDMRLPVEDRGVNGNSLKQGHRLRPPGQHRLFQTYYSRWPVLIQWVERIARTLPAAAGARARAGHGLVEMLAGLFATAVVLGVAHLWSPIAALGLATAVGSAWALGAMVASDDGSEAGGVPARERPRSAEQEARELVRRWSRAAIRLSESEEEAIEERLRALARQGPTSARAVVQALAEVSAEASGIHREWIADLFAWVVQEMPSALRLQDLPWLIGPLILNHRDHHVKALTALATRSRASAALVIEELLVRSPTLKEWTLSSRWRPLLTGDQRAALRTLVRLLRGARGPAHREALRIIGAVAQDDTARQRLRLAGVIPLVAAGFEDSDPQMVQASRSALRHLVHTVNTVFVPELEALLMVMAQTTSPQQWQGMLGIVAELMEVEQRRGAVAEAFARRLLQTRGDAQGRLLYALRQLHEPPFQHRDVAWQVDDEVRRARTPQATSTLARMASLGLLRGKPSTRDEVLVGQILNRQRDLNIRRRAINLLSGRLIQVPGAESLAEVLEDRQDDPILREGMVDTLWMVGTPRVVEAYRRVATDTQDSLDLRVGAIKGLGSLRRREDILLVYGLLQDGQAKIRRAAYLALDRFNSTVLRSELGDARLAGPSIPVTFAPRAGKPNVAIIVLDSYHRHDQHGERVEARVRWLLGPSSDEIPVYPVDFPDSTDLDHLTRQPDQEPLRSIERLLDEHRDTVFIINMSLLLVDPAGVNGMLPVAAVRELGERWGAVVVCGAGNDDKLNLRIAFPRLPHVLPIAAADAQRGQKAPLSSYGPDVFMAVDPRLPIDSRTQERYTSFAAPIVTTRLARLLADNPSLEIADAISQLKQEAQRMRDDSLGRQGWLGAGLWRILTMMVAGLLSLVPMLGAVGGLGLFIAIACAWPPLAMFAVGIGSAWALGAMMMPEDEPRPSAEESVVAPDQALRAQAEALAAAWHGLNAARLATIVDTLHLHARPTLAPRLAALRDHLQQLDALLHAIQFGVTNEIWREWSEADLPTGVQEWRDHLARVQPPAATIDQELRGLAAAVDGHDRQLVQALGQRWLEAQDRLAEALGLGRVSRSPPIAEATVTAPTPYAPSIAEALWTGAIEPVWGQTVDRAQWAQVMEYYRTVLVPVAPLQDITAVVTRLERRFLAAHFNAAQRSGRFPLVDLERLRSIVLDDLEQSGSVRMQAYLQELGARAASGDPQIEETWRQLTQVLSELWTQGLAQELHIYRFRRYGLDPSNAFLSSLRSNVMWAEFPREPKDVFTTYRAFWQEAQQMFEAVKAAGIWLRSLDEGTPEQAHDRLADLAYYLHKVTRPVVRQTLIGWLDHTTRRLAEAGHPFAQAVWREIPDPHPTPHDPPLRWFDLRALLDTDGDLLADPAPKSVQQVIPESPPQEPSDGMRPGHGPLEVVLGLFAIAALIGVAHHWSPMTAMALAVGVGGAWAMTATLASDPDDSMPRMTVDTERLFAKFDGADMLSAYFVSRHVEAPLHVEAFDLTHPAVDSQGRPLPGAPVEHAAWVTDDPALGSTADGLVGELVMVHVPKGQPASIYSTEHSACASAALRAMRDGKVVIMHAHLFPSDDDLVHQAGAAQQQLERVMAYLTDPARGFSDVELVLTVNPEQLGLEAPEALRRHLPPSIEARIILRALSDDRYVVVDTLTTPAWTASRSTLRPSMTTKPTIRVERWTSRSATSGHKLPGFLGRWLLGTLAAIAVVGLLALGPSLATHPAAWKLLGVVLAAGAWAMSATLGSDEPNRQPRGSSTPRRWAKLFGAALAGASLVGGLMWSTMRPVVPPGVPKLTMRVHRVASRSRSVQYVAYQHYLGNPLTVHMMTVDLYNRRIGVVPVVAKDGGWAKTTDQVRWYQNVLWRHHGPLATALGAINGGYHFKQPAYAQAKVTLRKATKISIGRVKRRGLTLVDNPPAMPRSEVGFMTPTAEAATQPIFLTPGYDSPSTIRRLRAQLDNLLTGGPTLIRDGRLWVSDRLEKFTRRQFISGQRSVVAQTKRGKLLFITVTHEHPTGRMSFRYLAQMLLEMRQHDPIINAICMDGGGSSSLWVLGEQQLVGHGDREIANVLLVVVDARRPRRRELAHRATPRPRTPVVKEWQGPGSEHTAKTLTPGTRARIAAPTLAPARPMTPPAPAIASPSTPPKRKAAAPTDLFGRGLAVLLGAAGLGVAMMSAPWDGSGRCRNDLMLPGARGFDEEIVFLYENGASTPSRTVSDTVPDTGAERLITLTPEKLRRTPARHHAGHTLNGVLLAGVSILAMGAWLTPHLPELIASSTLAAVLRALLAVGAPLIWAGLLMGLPRMAAAWRSRGPRAPARAAPRRLAMRPGRIGSSGSSPISEDENPPAAHPSTDALSRSGDAVEQGLVRQHKGLVIDVARQLAREGDELEDLIGIGSVGLVNGIRGFDPTRGVAESTYLRTCIVNEIRKHQKRERQRRISTVSLDEDRSGEASRAATLAEVLPSRDADLTDRLMIKDFLKQLPQIIADAIGGTHMNATNCAVATAYLLGILRDEPVSYETLGRLHNISTSTVGNSIRQARRALLKHMPAQGFEGIEQILSRLHRGSTLTSVVAGLALLAALTALAPGLLALAAGPIVGAHPAPLLGLTATVSALIRAPPVSGAVLGLVAVAALTASAYAAIRLAAPRRAARLFESVPANGRVLWRRADAPIRPVRKITLAQILANRQALREFGIRRPHDADGTPLEEFLVDLGEREIADNHFRVNLLAAFQGPQHTGSFKPWIMGQFFLQMLDARQREAFARRYTEIVTWTTGNQGQAVAWLVHTLRRVFPAVFGRLRAVIYASADTPPYKLQRMRAYDGTEVRIVEGKADEAQRRAMAHGEQPGAYYMTHSGPSSVASFGAFGVQLVEDLLMRWKTEGLVNPAFDTERFLRLAAEEELVRISPQDAQWLQARREELRPLFSRVAVIVPVGAGGLASGMLVALKKLFPQIVVVGVASDGTDAMGPALQAGRAVRIQTSDTTLGDGVKTSIVERFALEVFQATADGMVTVLDRHVPNAMEFLARFKIRAEGAAAMPELALRVPAVQAKLAEAGIDTVVEIVTGQNIDPRRHREIIRKITRADAPLKPLKIDSHKRSQLLREVDEALEEVLGWPPRFVLFGSARIVSVLHPLYGQAVALGMALFVLAAWHAFRVGLWISMVTGAGPGPAMAGGPRGWILARRLSLIPEHEGNRVRGVALALNTEPTSRYIDVVIRTLRFFARKLLLFSTNVATVLVTPGGIGTMLEWVRAWQLGIPIVIFHRFWRPVIEAMYEGLREAGYLDDELPPRPKALGFWGVVRAIPSLIAKAREHDFYRADPKRVHGALRRLEANMLRLRAWPRTVVFAGAPPEGSRDLDTALELARELLRQDVPVRAATRPLVAPLLAVARELGKEALVYATIQAMPQDPPLSEVERALDRAGRLIATPDDMSLEVLSAKNNRGLVGLPSPPQRVRLGFDGNGLHLVWDLIQLLQMQMIDPRPVFGIGAAFWHGHWTVPIQRMLAFRPPLVSAWNARLLTIVDRQAGEGTISVPEAAQQLVDNPEPKAPETIEPHHAPGAARGWRLARRPASAGRIEILNRLVWQQRPAPALVVWDFDDTLYPGYPRTIEARLWAQIVFEVNDPNRRQLHTARHFLDAQRGRTWEEGYRDWRAQGRPGPDYDVFVERTAEARAALRADMLRRGLSLVDGAEEVLAAVKAQSRDQVIVSEGSTARLQQLLHGAAVAPLVDEVLGGGEKPEKLLALMVARGLRPRQVVAIGDSEADIYAAKLASRMFAQELGQDGGEILVVGFVQTPADRQRLAQAGADVIIPRDYADRDAVLRALKLPARLGRNGSIDRRVLLVTAALLVAGLFLPLLWHIRLPLMMAALVGLALAVPGDRSMDARPDGAPLEYRVTPQTRRPELLSLLRRLAEESPGQWWTIREIRGQLGMAAAGYGTTRRDLVALAEDPDSEVMRQVIKGSNTYQYFDPALMPAVVDVHHRLWLLRHAAEQITDPYLRTMAQEWVRYALHQAGLERTIGLASADGEQLLRAMWEARAELIVSLAAAGRSFQAGMLAGEWMRELHQLHDQPFYPEAQRRLNVALEQIYRDLPSESERGPLWNRMHSYDQMLRTYHRILTRQTDALELKQAFTDQLIAVLAILEVQPAPIRRLVAKLEAQDLADWALVSRSRPIGLDTLSHAIGSLAPTDGRSTPAFWVTSWKGLQALATTVPAAWEQPSVRELITLWIEQLSRPLTSTGDWGFLQDGPAWILRTLGMETSAPEAWRMTRLWTRLSMNQQLQFALFLTTLRLGSIQTGWLSFLPRRAFHHLLELLFFWWRPEYNPLHGTMRELLAFWPFVAEGQRVDFVETAVTAMRRAVHQLLGSREGVVRRLYDLLPADHILVFAVIEMLCEGDRLSTMESATAFAGPLGRILQRHLIKPQRLHGRLGRSRRLSNLWQRAQYLEQEVVPLFELQYRIAPDRAGRDLPKLLQALIELTATPPDDPLRLKYYPGRNPAEHGYTLLGRVGQLIMGVGQSTDLTVLVDHLVDMPFEGLDDPADTYAAHGRRNWQAVQVEMLLGLIARNPEHPAVIPLVRYLISGLQLRGNGITERNTDVFLAYEDVVNALTEEQHYALYRELSQVLLAHFSGQFRSSTGDPLRLRTRGLEFSAGLLDEMATQLHTNLSNLSLTFVERVLEYYRTRNPEVLRGLYSDPLVERLHQEADPLSQRLSDELNHLLSFLAHGLNAPEHGDDIKLVLEAEEAALDWAFHEAFGRAYQPTRIDQMIKTNEQVPGRDVLSDLLWTYRYLARRYGQFLTLEAIEERLGVLPSRVTQLVLGHAPGELTQCPALTAIHRIWDGVVPPHQRWDQLLIAVRELVDMRRRLRALVYNQTTRGSSDVDREGVARDPTAGQEKSYAELHNAGPRQGDIVGYRYQDLRLNCHILDSLLTQLELIVIPRALEYLPEEIRTHGEFTQAVSLLELLMQGLLETGVGSRELLDHVADMRENLIYRHHLNGTMSALFNGQITSRQDMIERIVLSLGVEHLGQLGLKAVLAQESSVQSFLARLPGHLVRQMHQLQDPYFYFGRELSRRIDEWADKPAQQRAPLQARSKRRYLWSRTAPQWFGLPGMLSERERLSPAQWSRKGRNLIVMTQLLGHSRVPPGWVYPAAPPVEKEGEIPTAWVERLVSEAPRHIQRLEEAIAQTGQQARFGARFGDPENPLVLTVRCGAPITIPGQLITMTNIGLNESLVPGLASRIGEWAAWDALRRFYEEWAINVYGMDREIFNVIIEGRKAREGVQFKSQLSATAMRDIAREYRRVIREFRREFQSDDSDDVADVPDDVQKQLLRALEVAGSQWYSRKAQEIRRQFMLAEEPATVMVQAQVFGSAWQEKGQFSYVGVTFTRPSRDHGELIDGEAYRLAQGSDVADGLVSPEPVTILKQEQPLVYEQHVVESMKLRTFFNHIQQIEWTVQRHPESGESELFYLQTRDEVSRFYGQRFDAHTLQRLRRYQVGRGKGVSGGAFGGLVILPETLLENPGRVKELWASAREQGLNGVVLVMDGALRPEHSHMMLQVDAVISRIGGETPHAADLANLFGKHCIEGVAEIHREPGWDYVLIGEHRFNDGDVIIIDGNRDEGRVYRNPGFIPEISNDPIGEVARNDQVKEANNRSTGSLPEHLRRRGSIDVRVLGVLSLTLPLIWLSISAVRPGATGWLALAGIGLVAGWRLPAAASRAAAWWRARWSGDSMPPPPFIGPVQVLQEIERHA